MVWHKDLAGGRWQKLSLLEQMGNVGSEVGRAIKAHDPQAKKEAAHRALELLSFTLDDKRWHGRGSELARAYEVVSDFLIGSNIYKSDSKSIENYFMQFAIAARQQTAILNLRVKN